MKMTDITISISYKYMGKYGIEDEIVNTIDGEDLQEDAHFDDEHWEITKEDFLEQVDLFFECQWFKNKLKEKESK